MIITTNAEITVAAVIIAVTKKQPKLYLQKTNRSLTGSYLLEYVYDSINLTLKSGNK